MNIYTIRPHWLGVCALAMLCFSAIAQAEPAWRYVVRPGDTLIGISKRYLIDAFKWSEIQKSNALVNPHRLRPGQTLSIPLSMLRQKPVPAKLTSFSGDVRLVLSNGSTQPIQLNQLLYVGDQIETANNSTATLIFADESQLTVQPQSLVTLDTMSVYEGGGMADTKVRLQQGRAEIQANPNKKPQQHMQIITPSAVAAVRGTQFRVSAESIVTREETTEGAVALEASGVAVELAKGYGSVAEQGKQPSAPVQLLEAPSIQHLPAKVTQLPMRFELEANLQAKAWQGQVATDQNFQSVLLHKRSEKPTLSFSDLPDGRYYLRVRAEDKHGLQGFDAVHVFELDARPFAPALLSPQANGTVRDARPVLQWAASQGITQYRVELSQDALFQVLVDSVIVSQPHWQPAQSLSQGTYFWRVASVATEGQGPFVVAQAFQFKPLPGVPVLEESALRIDRETMQLQLPPPPAGLYYELTLGGWQGRSADGQVTLPRPNSGQTALSVRMVEEDGTAGPYATQMIDVPKQTHWEGLLFLLPILAL